MGDLIEFIKKRKFMTKIFFSDNVEENSKNLWKMMSADVKANMKQHEIKDLVTYLTILCKKYLQNLKYNVNRGCIFHLILGGIPSTLILPIKNRGVRGFLNWQDDSPKWHLICLVNTICIHLINPSPMYNKINPSLVW